MMAISGMGRWALACALAGSTAAMAQGDMLISAARGWCVARGQAPLVAGDAVRAAPCDGSDARQRWALDEQGVHPDAGPGLCLAGAGRSWRLADCGGEAAPWRWGERGLERAGERLMLGADNRLQSVPGEDAASSLTGWQRLSALAERVARDRDRIVSYPLPATDRNALELEAARHLVNQLTPPDAPLPAPRDVSGFPGAVPDWAPRVTATVRLDRRFTTYSVAGWTQKTRNWLATGLYAPAGETLTVAAPDDPASLDGVTLRIGPHTDVIARARADEFFLRYPSVSLAAPLAPGLNRVRSQYGGLVVVESARSANVSLALTIAGAVEAPLFRLGVDTPGDWLRARTAPAPWAVLQGERAVLVVPSAQVRALDNPAAVMHAYDVAQTEAERFAGFDGSAPAHPRLDGRQWFVEDVQIGNGYGHAGFPIMTLVDWKLASVDAASNWGVMHETGHNYQAFCLWASRYGLESTVNLIPLYVAETLRGQPALLSTLRFSRAIAKLRPGFDFDRDADKDDKLVFLAQLRYAFPALGWEIFRQLNRRYRELPAATQRAICASPQRQTDTLYELLSDIVGLDLVGHFRHWGVPLSDAAVARVAARGLAPPAFPTWLVNPE